MTVLAMEGFEHGDISCLDYTESMSDGSISTSYGRLGGKGIYFSSGDTMYKYIPGNQTILYVGFAHKPTAYGGGTNSIGQATYCPMTIYTDIGFCAGMTHKATDGLLQWCVRVNDSWQWIDGTFQTLLDKWVYMEFLFNMHDTTGAFTWKVNGQTISSETGIDTLYSTSTRIAYLDFGYHTILGCFDDIYITDNGFLGDVRVKGFMPDANGSINNFTPSAGSNYQCVDDAPGNNDTDYVSSGTQGHIDLYGITTGALATVKAIKVSNLVRKDDAGTREIRSICRSNGSNYNGNTEQVSDSYAPVQTIWETDPDDSNAWNQTKLEAAEFGLEIVT